MFSRDTLTLTYFTLAAILAAASTGGIIGALFGIALHLYVAAHVATLPIYFNPTLLCGTLAAITFGFYMAALLVLCWQSFRDTILAPIPAPPRCIDPRTGTFKFYFPR